MIEKRKVSLWRGGSSRLTESKPALLVAGLTLGMVLIAIAGDWKLVAAAAFAVGVLLVTRVRFAKVAALALVALIAVVALGGGASSDDGPAGGINRPVGGSGRVVLEP